MYYNKGKKGLPIVHSALSGVVFCLDFLGPSLFLLLFPCREFFFFPLFIYLFIYYLLTY
jgi:hypothetical protein